MNFVAARSSPPSFAAATEGNQSQTFQFSPPRWSPDTSPHRLSTDSRRRMRIYFAPKRMSTHEGGSNQPYSKSFGVGWVMEIIVTPRRAADHKGGGPRYTSFPPRWSPDTSPHRLSTDSHSKDEDLFCAEAERSTHEGGSFAAALQSLRCGLGNGNHRYTAKGRGPQRRWSTLHVFAPSPVPRHFATSFIDGFPPKDEDLFCAGANVDA